MNLSGFKILYLHFACRLLRSAALRDFEGLSMWIALLLLPPLVLLGSRWAATSWAHGWRGLLTALHVALCDSFHSLVDWSCSSKSSAKRLCNGFRLRSPDS